MKKRAYIKNQIQIIYKTRARFLSIFCIVFLGASFFAGLRHTPSIMEKSMDGYLKEYHYNDIVYISTLGFNQDIIDKVIQLKGVKAVEYGNHFDALIDLKDSSKGVTVYTNKDFNNEINKVEIIDGELPVKDNECIIDFNFTIHNKIKIGDKINLTNNNGTKEFIVKGIVNDPRYFSTIERGTNTLGDGTNDGFVEILSSGNEKLALPQTLYDLHGQIVYNEIRILVDNPKKYSIFSDEYLGYIKRVNNQIEKVIKKEIEDKDNEIARISNEELDLGIKEVSDNEIKYNEGVSRYNEGIIQYESGKQLYQDGLKQYNDGNQEYQNGVKQFDDGNNKYIQGWNAYLDGKEQYDQGLAKWQAKQLDYNHLVEQYQGLNQVYEQKLEQYSSFIESGVPEESLVELKTFLDQIKQELMIIKITFTNLKVELDKSKTELDGKGVLLEQNRITLENTKKTLDDSKKQLEDNKVALINSKQQLDNSKKILDESKKKLDQTKLDLDIAKKELDKAKIKISNSDNLLKNSPTNRLITFTREENASILSYISTCESIEALAIVFPLLFFLVAALVSLTTMTRMVEEQRVQSGVFRALGYDKKDVINQYLIYAFLATFFASVIGMIMGVFFFPGIIYFLYQTMLFNVGAIIIFKFNLLICIQTFIISVAITLLVTYLVVHQELNETPACLLRPKPPKIGKRILIERITVLWKRLSFNQKVTLRNIFRYKKRFFMSIIGIAGCTSLIVVGLGIKNSVSTIADKQYGNIWTYDGITVFNNNLNFEELEAEQEDFKNSDNILNISNFYRKVITINNNKEYYGTLEVFKNDQELSKYIKLEDYQNHKRLKLQDDGVVISAKLSELLKVRAGDKINVKIDNTDYRVKVTGVTLLHFEHHVYMNEKLYQQLTNERVLKNYVYFSLKDIGNEAIVTKYCNQNDYIESVNYISGISQGFRDQMGSIDSVVLILIACAGALAFIVLYNLTNINIQERKSEIATIKVLGFYPREVYDYVFRENVILGLIGSLVGLGLGKLIHMFIISTVEVEIAMFVRSVNLMSYIYAIVITMFFTLAINFAMRKVLNNIDMVESLKSIE